MYLNSSKITAYYTLLVSLLVGFTQTSEAQELYIVSNTSDWVVSDNYDGPWRSPVSQSSHKCHDPVYINDQCGTYPTPNNKLGSCPEALPIWGDTDPNNDCYWPPDTFYFKTSFYIPHSATIDSINGFIAVDNFFNLFVNDKNAGNHGTGSERWAIDFDLTERDHNHINIVHFLKRGNNTITVQAWNVHGGSCFNYALFTFCLKIYGIGLNEDINCLQHKEIVVYPNPADFKFYIKVNCEKEVKSIYIYDAIGQSFLQYFTHREVYTIDSALLPSGVYFIEVIYTDGTRKIEKVNIIQ